MFPLFTPLNLILSHKNNPISSTVKQLEFKPIPEEIILIKPYIVKVLSYSKTCHALFYFTTVILVDQNYFACSRNLKSLDNDLDYST